MAEFLDRFVDVHGRILPFAAIAVAGKVMAHENTLRALENLRLVSHERGKETMLLDLSSHVAALYKDVEIDKSAIAALLEEYGDDSPVCDFLRYIYFVYSRFMPVSDSDIQWITKNLKISNDAVRFNQRHILPKHEVGASHR